MIPLIAYTSRLTLIAASRALLTAELTKPHYFPILLGAQLPAHWPPGQYDEDAMRYFLEQLTAGGRTAAGWYGWYAILKAGPETPKNTLVGAGGFHGPPQDETVEIGFSIADDWRGRGLGTELVAGLIRHAADTGLVRQLTARTTPANTASRRILEQNGFCLSGPDPDAEGQLHFVRDLVAADKSAPATTA
ncbi:RimJ/RimL family protein N-acetyltransferase [Hymenobacter luteus]|uniref:RimJ/RimL family protein N-acetyltransferase n=2 Tax=Hymenobacter TaxID=89966 RepID=A0A7W9SZR7_9BACT|nr:MULTISPECIES: GNAT family N-acetyltransferase [Hymenobacter]MBB4599491.1 RimJ/RimL family protein N-acetyltransferase [Hymenobacter latericoloratus]MBB6058199.1 RimJ/RimL family protein N-acetyltransferase [Hymenobacter luteus]